MIFFQLCFSVITKLKMRHKSTNSVDKSQWHLLIASQRFDQFRYQHCWSRKRRTTFFNGVVSTQRRAARRKRISCRTVCADDALGIVLFPFVVIFISVLQQVWEGVSVSVWRPDLFSWRVYWCGVVWSFYNFRALRGYQFSAEIDDEVQQQVQQQQRTVWSWSN